MKPQRVNPATYLGHYRAVVSQLWAQLRRSIAGSVYYTPSFAQEGEDILLMRLLDGRQAGFYVDIGAHHPKRFSNTYLFYQLGWRGINIDATPGSMKAFHRQRPRDRNIEVAVGTETAVQTFYLFDDPALNTFDEHLVKERTMLGYSVTATRQVQVRRLADLLAEALPVARRIDFMSIDVEGLDLEVLKSNDWARFRPDFVLIEKLERYVDKVTESDVYTFMIAQQYRLCAKSLHTLFFQNEAITT